MIIVNETPVQLVSFAGKMGSGKDTCADFLVENHGFTKLAFADTLKQIAMDLAQGLTREQCYDQEAKIKPFENPYYFCGGMISQIVIWLKDNLDWELTDVQVAKLQSERFSHTPLHSPREFLQYLGTELLRNCVADDFHAQCVERKIIKDKLTKVVISDCRFPNEREIIGNKWNGISVLIKRPINDIEGGGISGHASETLMGTEQDYDFTIKNEYSLKALESMVELVIRHSDLKYKAEGIIYDIEKEATNSR
jgi:hypothetical protein